MEPVGEIAVRRLQRRGGKREHTGQNAGFGEAHAEAVDEQRLQRAQRAGVEVDKKVPKAEQQERKERHARCRGERFRGRGFEQSCLGGHAASVLAIIAFAKA